MFRVATLDDAQPIYSYLRRKLPDPFERWPEENSRTYIQWYIESQLCGVVASPAIEAVVMGRPVGKLSDGDEERFVADWQGHILWVECCASDEGMLGVWKGAMDFFQVHRVRLTHVAWRRAFNRRRLHCFPIERVESLLR